VRTYRRRWYVRTAANSITNCITSVICDEKRVLFLAASVRLFADVYVALCEMHRRHRSNNFGRSAHLLQRSICKRTYKQTINKYQPSFWQIITDFAVCAYDIFDADAERRCSTSVLHETHLRAVHDQQPYDQGDR